MRPRSLRRIPDIHLPRRATSAGREIRLLAVLKGDGDGHVGIPGHVFAGQDGETGAQRGSAVLAGHAVGHGGVDGLPLPVEVVGPVLPDGGPEAIEHLADCSSGVKFVFDERGGADGAEEHGDVTVGAVVLE